MSHVTSSVILPYFWCIFSTSQINIPLQDDILVEFSEKRAHEQFGTGEVSQWMKVNIINERTGCIDESSNSRNVEKVTDGIGVEGLDKKSP